MSSGNVAVPVTWVPRTDSSVGSVSVVNRPVATAPRVPVGPMGVAANSYSVSARRR